MIPVLAITTLNQLSSVDRLIKSINYPVQVCSILCNNYDVDYFLEVRKLCKNDYVKEFVVSHCPYNTGCAGGWNYHIKHNPSAPYWLIVNDDVVFGSADLVKFDGLAECYDVVCSLFPNDHINRWYYFSMFSLTQKVVKTVGLFDENFYPAYYEDTDYKRRLAHHGFEPYVVSVDGHHGGASTAGNCQTDNRKLLMNKYFEMNRQYNDSKITTNDYSAGKFDLQYRIDKPFTVKEFSK